MSLPSSATASAKWRTASDARRSLVDYVAYGLRVRSPVPLPFTALRMRAPAPDVTVRLGAVPETLQVPAHSRRRLDGWPEWEAAPGIFLLRTQGVARCLVTEGRDILVEPRGGDDREIGEHLAKAAWTALLLQRGVIPFHASAVASEEGAVLFMGRSGAGKSSLLGAFLKRGYAMLADDIVGVVPDSFSPLRGASAPRLPTRFLALPAYPRLRLCANALDALAWRGQALDEGKRPGKYLVPVRCFHASPLPIRSLYLLDSHSRSVIEIERVRSASAIEALRRQVLLKRLMNSLGWRQECFRTVVAMVRQAPVARVRRSAHALRLGALADRVEAHLRDWSAPGGGIRDAENETAVCGGVLPALEDLVRGQPAV